MSSIPLRRTKDIAGVNRARGRAQRSPFRLRESGDEALFLQPTSRRSIGAGSACALPAELGGEGLSGGPRPRTAFLHTSRARQGKSFTWAPLTKGM